MKNFLLSTVCAAFLLQGPTAFARDATQTAESQASAEQSAEPTRAGPALWKLSDEDTTIYLFGTVHALPRDTVWFTGPVKQAVDASDALITEIPSNSVTDPASQQMIAVKAMLPSDKSVREFLDEEQRVAYEVAMSKLGLPVEAFDRFEPWFAGMTLAMLPLMKAGYDMESGVEKVVEKQAPSSAKRDALETIDYQIDMFDTLPMASQVAFLMSSAGNIDEVSPMMDKMLAEWIEGDADGLAALLNEGLTDQVLADVLLYRRNQNWAQWIGTRMDQPGTVFVAVGAGHLAGDKSVQNYLAERGFTVERVQ